MWEMWQSGHSGKSCPFTQEDVNIIGNANPNNSDNHPQQDWNSRPDLPFGHKQGNNVNNSIQPSLKDLVYVQKHINNNVTKKFLADNKIFKSLAAQLERLNPVIENQLSFNKMIETQVAQLASSCLNHNTGKLLG